ncbi:MAG: ATP-binding protein, partial [Bacteroidales bacterium]|nr:ATP-binding protein [Bacteroidales bacterium]
FEQLFGDLYIGKHPTPKHNTYLVLNLDFSGLDTTSEKAFAVSLSGKIRDNVRGFLRRYKHLFPEGDIYSEEIKIEQPGVASLQKAFNAAEAAGKKMFIIIDEYDHFANDLIAQGTYIGNDIYRHVVRANGIIRDFYETLKEGGKTVIDRIILTGITPIMLDDITSGFNIANNLSLKKRYNEMLGFTQEEVNTLTKETGIDLSMMNINIELLYNGYLFHPDGEHKMYNPTMMLYLLDSISKDGTIENIIDDNLTMDYGRLKQLVQHEENRAQLLQIAEDNGIGSDIIHRFSIDKLQENEYFTSLLFYLGLLTINKDKEGVTYLKIPNYSIRTIYWDYILRIIKDCNKDVTINYQQQREAVKMLAFKNDPQPYLDYVSQKILIRLSNRDLKKFDEKYIKIVLMCGLFQSNMYLPITEMEVEQGYMDIYLQRSSRFPNIPYEWVWEIKYVKKGEAKPWKNTVLKRKREKARTQLQKYRSSYLFEGRTDVKFLSVIFIGKDKYEIEEM